MSEIGSSFAIDFYEEGSVATEGDSHLAEEGSTLFIVASTGNDGDVPTPNSVDFVKGNLWETKLFSDPTGLVTSAIDAFCNNTS